MNILELVRYEIDKKMEDCSYFKNRIEELRAKMAANLEHSMSQKEYDAICDIYKAELELAETELQNRQKRLTRVMDFNTIYYCHIRYVDHKKMKRLENTISGICMDTHPINHIVETGCGHLFGKECFHNFVKFHYEDGCEIMRCPICRAIEFDLMQYKAKQKGYIYSKAVWSREIAYET